MIIQSKNNLRLQAGNAATPMSAIAPHACPQTVLGTVTDTVMWTTPLCARITRKDVGGRNGHPEGVS
jgi:hypothetical protein